MDAEEEAGEEQEEATRTSLSLVRPAAAAVAADPVHHLISLCRVRRSCTRSRRPAASCPVRNSVRTVAASPRRDSSPASPHPLDRVPSLLFSCLSYSPLPPSVSARNGGEEEEEKDSAVAWRLCACSCRAVAGPSSPRVDARARCRRPASRSAAHRRRRARSPAG